MRRIECVEDIIDGLDALCRIDPRLSAVRAAAGDVPLRRSDPGFESLASIIVSQQVSRASAEAIFERLSALLNPLTHEAVLGAGEAVFRQAGLSRPKQKALLAVAAAVEDGKLDLDGLCTMDADEAIGRMTAISGIGPWTAEIYLLISAGHPDIFPVRDIALKAAVAEAFGLSRRPGDRELHAISETWSPWRGVASRLFWAYYREMRGREGAPDRQIA